MMYKFLGQDVNVGRFTGRTSSRTAIVEQAGAFSILAYFLENVEGGLSNPDGAAAIFKQGSTNTFAIAYRQTDLYGWSTFVKWANSINPISDNDFPPSAAPFGGWVLVGSYDPNNITIADYGDNCFGFYTLESGLTPYWEGSTNQYLTEDQLLNSSPTNLFLCLQLKNYDASVPVEFTGETPILIHGGAFTNWLDSSTVDDPSYALDGIGMTTDYIYNPLNIDGVEIINDFEKDDSSAGGGYGGNYGYMGAEWGVDDMLELTALDTGVIDMYSPEKAQVQALASFLWSDGFIDNVKKAWAEPLESIIMFGIVPLDLDNWVYSPAEVAKIGGVNTGVAMYRLKEQRIPIECGTITVDLSNTNVLDFEPFTTAQVYLPFIGFCPIKVNDIMSSRVTLTYHVDLLSGDCVAFIECARQNAAGMNWWNKKSVRYQYRGNMMINVPLCARDYSTFYKTLILGAVNSLGSAASGNLAGGATGLVSAALSAQLEGPDIQRSGNYSGSVAALMNRTPALFLFRAKQQKPENYSKYIGYPSFMTMKLKDVKGFTMVEAVIDNTVSATDTEKTMIEDLLKGGIII